MGEKPLSIQDVERLEQQRAREQKKIRARKEKRATYDLPPALRERIRELAEEQHLPASQLVTLALLRLLKDYETNELNLSRCKQPSRSPRYDWNLAYPPDLLALLKRPRKA